MITPSLPPPYSRPLIFTKSAVCRRMPRKPAGICGGDGESGPAKTGRAHDARIASIVNVVLDFMRGRYRDSDWICAPGARRQADLAQKNVIKRLILSRLLPARKADYSRGCVVFRPRGIRLAFTCALWRALLSDTITIRYEMTNRSRRLPFARARPAAVRGIVTCAISRRYYCISKPIR